MAKLQTLHFGEMIQRCGVGRDEFLNSLKSPHSNTRSAIHSTEEKKRPRYVRLAFTTSATRHEPGHAGPSMVTQPYKSRSQQRSYLALIARLLQRYLPLPQRALCWCGVIYIQVRIEGPSRLFWTPPSPSVNDGGGGPGRYGNGCMLLRLAEILSTHNSSRFADLDLVLPETEAYSSVSARWSQICQHRSWGARSVS